MDRNFIDFKFGDHWASEFNLVVVSAGDRYSPPIYGNVNPNTTTVAGKTGVYKWKTQIGEKVFNMNIAFDKVTMRDVNQIKQWLNPNKINKLILSEEPHKFYWCSLNTEPDFSFVPFIEETIQVGNKKIVSGVYKGELTLQFICADNYGYSINSNYEDVEIEKDIFYKDKYSDTIIPWVTASNLLENETIYNDNDIYLKSFTDVESGDATTSGISTNRPVYLYNAGTSRANLNLTFDLIIPAEDSPLIIKIESCKLTDNGIQILNEESLISISNFSNFKPFLDIYDGNLDNWQIEIDSELCEVYVKHKTDKTKIISLNKFNDEQSFLSLANCKFVDYLKPFPTSITTISNSAIENTIFNKLSVASSAQDYRLKNVYVDWKHTYI